MRRLFLLILLLIASPAWAATYHYAKAGSNANSCATATSATPANAKLTIQAALNCAAAGDTVTSSDTSVQTYYERNLAPTVSGTLANRITVSGARGPIGQYYTIVDGSDALTTWTAEPDMGVGVYSTTKPTWVGPITGLTNDPCILVSNGNSIWHISWEYTDGGLNSTLIGESGLTTLARGPTDDIWAGVDALFANQGSKTYIHFKNGDNPNSKTIRVAPKSQKCYEPPYSTPDFGDFYLNGTDYVTIQNFELQGAIGVVLHAVATGNTIENNRIHDGTSAVYIDNGPSGTTVQNNTAFQNLIGNASVTPGSWTPYSGGFCPLCNIYNIGKYIAGTTDSQIDYGIFSYADSATTISGNALSEYAGGSFFRSSINFSVTGNTIQNCSSTATYFQGIDGTNTISNNLFNNCNTGVRGNYMQDLPSTLTLYVYKNRVYQPPDKGGWLYFSESTSPGTTSAKFYVYHNSQVGGSAAYELGSQANQYFPNALFINNLVQMATTNWPPYYDTSYTNTICASSSGAAAWDYNWTFGNEAACNWVFGHNIQASAKLFNDAAPPSNWAPPAGSAPLGAGIDVSASFTVNSIMYSALPGVSPGYAHDIGAVDSTDPAQAGTTWLATDNFDSGTPGADLDGRSGGTDWTSNWAKDPFGEYGTDGAFTIETAPSGMSGNAIRSASTNPANYYRNFVPISAGQLQFLFQSSINNPNDEILFAPFGSQTGETWLGGVRADTDGHFKLITTSEAEVDMGAYSANTTYCIQYQFDAGAHPNQARASVDGGAFTAWTDTFSHFSTVASISIQDRTTNAANIYFDTIGVPVNCNPNQTVTVIAPVSGSRLRLPSTVDVQWTTSNISSGTVDLTYSFDGFTTSTTIATGIAYNATPYTFTPTWPAQSSMQIKVCKGSVCGTSPTFSTAGQYFK